VSSGQSVANEADWFGETPVVMREFSPSHFEQWYQWCQSPMCQEKSVVYAFEIGKHLCSDHAEDWIT
jgi:hypothetical protein